MGKVNGNIAERVVQGGAGGRGEAALTPVTLNLPRLTGTEQAEIFLREDAEGQLRLRKKRKEGKKVNKTKIGVIPAL